MLSTFVVGVERPAVREFWDFSAGLVCAKDSLHKRFLCVARQSGGAACAIARRNRRSVFVRERHVNE